MPTQARLRGVFTKIVVYFLLHSHPQAGDEDESGANVSQVTRPEERRLPPHVTHSHTCTDIMKLPPARRHTSQTMIKHKSG